MASRPNRKRATPGSAPATRRSLSAAWWFVIAFAVVVGALIWYLRFTPEPDYTYRGFPITKGQCPSTAVVCYFLDIRIRTNEYTITFYHHPSELEDVNVTAQSVATMYVLQTRRDPQILMGLPENAPGSIGVAATELARVLGTRYDIFNFPVHPAIIGASPDKISCGNVTASTVVVLFQQEDLTRVYAASPNCIIVAGKEVRDVVRAADAYAYHLLQVMDTPDLRVGSSPPAGTNATADSTDRVLPVPPAYGAANNTSAP